MKLSYTRQIPYGISYMWNLKSSTCRNRVEWRLPRARYWKKWENVGERVKTFSYMTSKFWESNIQHGDYS